ncbi:MAG: CMD domain protein [Candidatus Devosia phytovorans]|uniref:CMD domain protein n=1 Tax=Candidatus Devosia phytovorans TaxID=3121372 RepID=A0AAJ6B303_9HYPH|nr:CMD domain protein [Devosia sp.]WEK05993.1 MAG: CMD domain protein [Devosia sp.]
MSHDLIDQVLSITPGSHLDQLRRHREVARENIQKAYDALFAPRDTNEVSLVERLAIASFVTGLHGQIVLADHYAHLLSTSEGGVAVAALINEEIERGTTEGPYGTYPAGPLASENKQGPLYAVAPANRTHLGLRLRVALEHAHLLVFRPRDASREALHGLINAGWSTAGVVTISQLVAYLAFQTRIVEGLSTLAATDVTAPRLPKVAPASAIA